MNVLIESNIQYALTQGENKTRNFFELINFLQVNTEIYQNNGTSNDQIFQLSKFLCSMIQERDIIELNAKDEDVSLSGLFTTLRNILEKVPQIRENIEGKNQFLMYLIHSCLFDKDTKGQLMSKSKALPPKCKHNMTRENCLKLLIVLCLDNSTGVLDLIHYLKRYIGETFWRTQRKVDWQISVHQQERSMTGFVGLKNIHSICYMNSIMQQLFMMPTFRKAIIEVEDSSVDI